MDKIYSRPRICLPKLDKQSPDNPKRRKLVALGSICIVALLTAYYMVQAINPILNQACEAEAQAIATIISNNETTSTMKNYEYEDLVAITKDKEGNITGIKTNVIPINQIISEVPVRIQKAFDKSENNHIELSLGSLLGSKWLAAVGPKISIKILMIGDVLTDFKSEFTSVGINQTLHRLYLEIKCKVSILTPFDTIDKEITNQVILAENVIVGKIPNTYYNLEGLDPNQDALEVLE